MSWVGHRKLALQKSSVNMMKDKENRKSFLIKSLDLALSGRRCHYVINIKLLYYKF